MRNRIDLIIIRELHVSIFIDTFSKTYIYIYIYIYLNAYSETYQIKVLLLRSVRKRFDMYMNWCSVCTCSRFRNIKIYVHSHFHQLRHSYGFLFPSATRRYPKHSKFVFDQSFIYVCQSSTN